MPSAALRIALIEPNAACAAELGQLLSESLQDFRIELSESSAADLVLLNEAESEPPNTPGPTIVFTRSQNGRYRAHALQGGSLSGRQTVPFIMPLTDSIRCALLLQVSRRSEAGPDESKDGVVLPGQSRRLQERLLQLQNMEAIGELTGGIAHDCNNLLLVIRSYAEMLLEESALPPPARHYAKEILAASQRAAGLTRELLAISRRETPEMRPTNLNGAIENAVPMLSRLVGKEIVVWVKLPTELWPIQANAEQLEQVLINLASNARDAMPRGGKLLLETSNTVVEDKHAAMPPGDYVMLAISDTGVGIPRHILPRIFEPFFTTKERGKGTGLGLASVYGTVKQSGGYIWAYSETGYGTTFKIYLPRAAAAKLSTEEPAENLTARAAAGSGSV